MDKKKSGWLDEIADVEPIKKTTKNIVEDWDNLPKTSKQSPHTPKSEFEEMLEEPTQLSKEVATRQQLSPKGAFETDCGNPNSLSGATKSLDQKTRKRLAKGEYKVEGKIDLHGLTMDEAWEDLMKFLETAVNAGKRCVLVVHGKGKGYGEKGNMGLIKSKISGWLGEHPATLAFSNCLPKHGGSGAMYVLLRRK